MKKIIKISLIMTIFLFNNCTKIIDNFQYVNEKDIAGFWRCGDDTISLDTLNLIIDKHNDIYLLFHYDNNKYLNYKFSITNDNDIISMFLYYNNNILNKEYFKIKN
jgi:predicted nucleotide-binding protein (sugar kinase/HSP70/actin superfamily)